MFAELIREQQNTDSGAADWSHFPAAGRSAWPSDAAVWKAGDLDGVDGDGPDGGGDCRLGAAAGADPNNASAELKSLGHSALERRLVELVALRNRVEGEYLAALGELTTRYGAQAAAHVLRDQTRMNGAQARAESRLADSLREHAMSDTLDALRSGEIQLSHAKVIAREAPKKHRRSEDSFLGLCRVYPSDTVAKHTLAYESQQVYADLAAEAAAKDLDPVDAELAMQKLQRRASLRCGDDGMWHLGGRFDFLTGRQLSIALQAAVRSARHNTGTAASDSAEDAQAVEPTTAQLTADALADLICGTQHARRSNTGLVIVADYDIANDRLANPRLDDGTPISPRMLADLTLEPLPADPTSPPAARRAAEQTAEHAVAARVLPAVFSADWSQLALGRTRNANDAQRLILALRDGGCIGCELTPEHTEAHHIDHHHSGGPTEVPNLASLCRPCHRELHNHQRQIHTPPDGRPRLRPPEPSGTSPPMPDGTDPPRPNGANPPDPSHNEPPDQSQREPSAARSP